MSLVVLVALTAACGDDEGGGNGAPGAGDDEIPWGTELVSTEVTRDGEPDALVPGTEIRLSFRDDGSATASAGCNTLGIDDVSVVDGHLRATAGAMTEMGCDPQRHAQDEWLVAFLTSEPAWSWDGETLVLTADDAEVTLVDREVVEPDRPLEGTRWDLDTLIEGSGPDGAASSIPEQVDAFVVFEDGRITGNTGCNSLTGEATVEGDEIAFGMIATTLMLCDAPLGEVEAPMLAVLDGTVAWTVDANRLTLEHPSGNGLSFLASDG